MHPYKTLIYQGHKVHIDEEIAPLMRNIWKLGIHTIGCCQASCRYKCKHTCNKKKLVGGGVSYTVKERAKDCKGYVWVAFETARDYEKFLNVVAEFSKERNGMYEKMLGHAGYDHGVHWRQDPDNWELLTGPDNDGVLGHWEDDPKHGEYWESDSCQRNKFRIDAQLHFPRKHLVHVVARLNKAIMKAVRISKR